MRGFLIILFLCYHSFVFAQHDLDIAHSYVVDLNGVKEYGGIKLQIGAKKIKFLSNHSKTVKQLDREEISYFVRENKTYSSILFSNKYRWMEVISDSIYEYHKWGKRFFLDIHKDLNEKQLRKSKMKKKFIVLVEGKLYKITRFTMYERYEELFGLTGELLENCHFYEFERDIEALMTNRSE